MNDRSSMHAQALKPKEGALYATRVSFGGGGGGGGGDCLGYFVVLPPWRLEYYV